MSRPSVVDSVLELIGGTPMVRLRRIPRPGSADVYAKLEFMNPGGSVKDRAAFGMIRDAELRGYLKPGMTIIEPTAGNTGVGLAMAGALLGYTVIIVMPARYSREKRMLMQAFGATVKLLPEDQPMADAIRIAKEMAATIPGAYCPQQFDNQANPDTHYETTGREIWNDLRGEVDGIAIGAGTGGTFTGVARFLKERNPRVWCALVEPPGSVFGGGKPGKHHTEGIGNDWIPRACDMRLADEVIQVTDEQAFEMAREAARLEAILCGSSAGANLWGACRVAERLGPGKRVVTIIPDSGERYISKGLYGAP